MFKIVIRATSISKSYHSQRYMKSTQNGVSNRKGNMFAMASRETKSVITAKKISKTFARRGCQ